MKTNIKIIIAEKECPKCKGLMNKFGRYVNECELTLNEENRPQFFSDEIEHMSIIEEPEEIFWKCEDCDFKEEVKIEDGTANSKNI